MDRNAFLPFCCILLVLNTKKKLHQNKRIAEHSIMDRISQFVPAACFIRMRSCCGLVASSVYRLWAWAVPINVIIMESYIDEIEIRAHNYHNRLRHMDINSPCNLRVS